eukprot:g28998.t1
MFASRSTDYVCLVPDRRRYAFPFLCRLWEWRDIPVLTKWKGAGKGERRKEQTVYTAPLLEVVGGIESSAKGLFVGSRALAKLSRLAAFFSKSEARNGGQRGWW